MHLVTELYINYGMLAIAKVNCFWSPVDISDEIAR